MSEFSKNLILIIARVHPEGRNVEYNIGSLFIIELCEPQFNDVVICRVFSCLTSLQGTLRHQMFIVFASVMMKLV